MRLFLLIWLMVLGTHIVDGSDDVFDRLVASTSRVQQPTNAVFMTLFTGPANIERRNTLRTTWLGELLESGEGTVGLSPLDDGSDVPLITVRFFIGRVKSAELTQQLASEHDQHGGALAVNTAGHACQRLCFTFR
jgi:hypothetical protein